MLEGFSEAIIEGETNYIRFEKFCASLCERVEGLTFVPTSLNYDQGRDARATEPSTTGHRALICATLNKDLDEKVERDLAKLRLTSTPERLIYCCSQKLTEYKIDEIEKTIRKYIPTACAVTTLAAQQLSELCERHPDILERYYKAEIITIETNLLSFRRGHEPAETKGLRLALITFASDDANALRENISQRAVIEVLARLGTATENDVAHQLSNDLRLSKSLNPLYLRDILHRTQQAGLVAKTPTGWQLTTQGQETAVSVPPEAARGLLEGRTIVRKSLEQLMGHTLSDFTFNEIWTTLLDFLSELFYSNGVAVICAINAYLADDAAEREGASLEKLIEDGAARIRSVSTVPELSEEIEQAVMDMFTERTGPAFEWLARVCERFVALCALGLETTSSDELKRMIRRYQLVLDTDIVLTLLCEGEPDHQSTRDIIGRFRQLGGGLLVAPRILEEVAYHAHISDRQFTHTAYLLGKVKGQDLVRYIDNAFVRAFHVLSKNPTQWRLYRSQFVGQKPRDYANVMQVLQTELAIQMLPANHDPKLAHAIATYMKDLATAAGEGEEYHSADIGKTGRDGEILASIAAAREAKRASGSDSSICLVSSSGRLRRADHKFRNDLGLPEAVISFKSFSYMLAILPDAGLNPGSLKQALFDFGHTATLTDVERLALRVIKGSSQFDVPWAKRRGLEAQLDAVIRSEAAKRGVTPKKLERQIVELDPAANAPELIVTALRDIAIRDQTTVELSQANRKLKLLEAEVNELRAVVTDGISNLRSKIATTTN